VPGFARHVRFTLNAQSRCAPARCAGARAERLVADGEDGDSGVASINSRIVGVQRMMVALIFRASYRPQRRTAVRDKHAPFHGDDPIRRTELNTTWAKLRAQSDFSTGSRNNVRRADLTKKDRKDL
jgi:hypothetical protein